MESQPIIYTENKPSVTNKVVNCRFIGVMAMTFGQLLRQKLVEKGLTAAELSRRSGVTKQNIGRILNNTPHSITGALPKVEPDTVIKLAKPLAWDLDEALHAAGHAPTGHMTRAQELSLILRRVVRVLA